ncbi:mCG1032900 [Mus musculus]|nr:mCG1032900 [Mus musculus]
MKAFPSQKRELYPRSNSYPRSPLHPGQAKPCPCHGGRLKAKSVGAQPFHLYNGAAQGYLVDFCLQSWCKDLSLK